MMRCTSIIIAGLVIGVGAPGGHTAVSSSPQDGRAAVAVSAAYTMTNAPDGNEVLVYARAPGSGALTFEAAVATGGTGTGAGLGNQGGVTLTGDRRFLLVVNAGSDSISALAIHGGALVLTDSEPSGGAMPVSVTEHDGLVYVLNAAGSGSISGLELSQDGELTPLAGSTRPLSGADPTEPAQVQFGPHGDWLVVTERATNRIDVYSVADDGLATGPVVNTSSGMTPFGFSFDNRSRLIVSEAFGGASDASAVSSYSVNPDGTLATISGSVLTTETAACWIALTKNGRFAYTTNTGSGTITGYAVSRRTGRLTILNADGVTGSTGSGTGPIDMALSGDSRFAYVLTSGTIAVFAVNAATGALTSVSGGVSGLPSGANGLAAR